MNCTPGCSLHPQTFDEDINPVITQLELDTFGEATEEGK